MALPHRDHPRVDPITHPSPEVATLLGAGRVDPQGEPLAIFRTMARHPALLERWNGFASYFRAQGALSERVRELVVLRTAWRIDCAYEWGQHVLLARGVGVSEDEIDLMASDGSGETQDVSPEQALLIRFVDEMVEHTDVSDETWDALTAAYTLEQALELVMLVGLYVMAGGFLNVAGVQPEPHLPTWPAASGAAVSARR